MKLRDLVTSSLPRVIARRKKQQQQQQQPPPSPPPPQQRQLLQEQQQQQRTLARHNLQTTRPQEQPAQRQTEFPSQLPRTQQFLQERHNEQYTPRCPPLQRAIPRSPGLHNLQIPSPLHTTKGLHGSCCYDDNQNHCAAGPPELSTWGVSGGKAGLNCGCNWEAGEEETGCDWEGQDLVARDFHLYGTLNIRVAATPPQSCICVCCRRVLSCLAEADWDSYDNAVLRVEEEPNVVSKTRSRIRTNPWLPSPRPLATGFCTPAADFFPSSDLPHGISQRGSTPSQGIYSLAAIIHSPSPSPPPSCSDNSLSEFHPPDVTSSCDVTSSDCAMETDLSRASSGTTENDETSMSRSTEGSSERRSVSDRKLGLGNLNDLSRNSGVYSSAWDTDTSSDASPILECVQDKFGTLEQNVSFEYEEALDSTLERALVKCGNTNLSLQDLLEEDDTRDAAVQTEFDSSEESDWVADGGETISSEDYTSDFPCSDSATTPGWRQDCMQDSVDTGYFSLPRSGTTEMDDDLHSCREQQLPPQLSSLSDQAPFTPQESEVKVFPHQVRTSGMLRCEGPQQLLLSEDQGAEDSVEGTGRSLAEVQTSLQEKLRILRGDKERRTREDREEERRQKEQKQRFQRQVNLHRKQVLLETLRGLRARLEDQGDRLQSSYSAVLSMQQRYAQRRSPLAVMTASTT